MTVWPLVRLGDLCRPDRTIVEPGSSTAAPLLYLGLEHIEAETGLILKEPLDFAEDDVRSATFLFDSRHVLYGKLRPYLNKVALPDFDGRCTTEVIPLLPTSSVRREFLAWLLRRQETVVWALQQNTGSRMPRADIDSLLTLQVPLPPLEEQARIVAALDEGMALVRAARRNAADRLAAAEALPAAYLREVFEGSRWIVRELGELCRTITDGTHLPPPFSDRGLPFLFVRNIVSGVINFDVQKYISEETYSELTKKHKAEPGDVLFSAVGSFGVAAVVRTDARFAFQRHIAHIKPNPTLLDADFLGNFLNSPDGRSQSEAVAMGGAQRTVTLADLRRFQIPVPPLADQRRIASDLSRRLEAADSIRARCRDELATIKALPASLLRTAFNGNP